MKRQRKCSTLSGVRSPYPIHANKVINNFQHLKKMQWNYMNFVKLWKRNRHGNIKGVQAGESSSLPKLCQKRQYLLLLFACAIFVDYFLKKKTLTLIPILILNICLQIIKKFVLSLREKCPNT